MRNTMAESDYDHIRLNQATYNTSKYSCTTNVDSTCTSVRLHIPHSLSFPQKKKKQSEEQ